IRMQTQPHIQDKLHMAWRTEKGHFTGRGVGVSQKKTHDLESSSAFCESLRSFYDLNQTAVISPPHLGRDNQLLVVCSMCKTDPQGIHLEYVLDKAQRR